MNRRLVIFGLTPTFVFVVALAGGCSNLEFLDPMDPTQLGRFRPTPVVNIILDTLGVAEEESPVYAGAEEPRPIDVIETEEEYRFSVGDVIRISIFELLQEGRWVVNDYTVNETGKVSIPDIGQISVVGLTETELEDEIKQILIHSSILKDPTVTAVLRASQRRVFTILGDGVSRSSRFPLPRYAFRLTDALAVAGSVRQFNVSYIYVTRELTGTEAIAEPPVRGAEAEILRPKPVPAEPTEVQLRPVEPVPEPLDRDKAEEEMMEIISPYAGLTTAAEDTLISLAEMITHKELENSGAGDGLDPLESGAGAYLQGQAEAQSERAALQQQEPARVEWIFKDGRWVPVRIGAEVEEERATLRPEREVIPEPPKERAPEYYGWEQIGEAGVQRRVIKIPVEKLLGGDPRYNIIIQPGDTISVPVDIIGEAWIQGNVGRVGALNITGRPMNLKMAIAAAGGLGPLAWPSKVEVIRRISKNREETVMVDLAKISKGLQPDFFIKPHDLINVGTHPAARPLAVLRNALRATYGFGFVYDRNFVTTRSGRLRLLYDDSYPP